MAKVFKVTVLGAGNMGTAVAQHLAKLGHHVWLWDYNPETVVAIAREHENAQFLPGVKLSRRVVPEADMQKAVEGAIMVVIAVASPYVRTIARQLGCCLSTLLSHSESNTVKRRIPYNRAWDPSPAAQDDTVVVSHIAKGLEPKTNLTMHEVIQSELSAGLRRSVVTISGPSIAKEMVRGIPTAVVAAGSNARARELVRTVLEAPTLKVATSVDWKGVSICGALKNVYAIALGMCDGMQMTFNAKACLFTAALAEMERMVCALDGKHDTTYGLAGLGDMVVTGLGDGRNRALGEQICKAGHCKFVWNKNATTHEGVAATKVFYDLARRKKLHAPLIAMVYHVLYRGADPCKVLTRFFSNCTF